MGDKKKKERKGGLGRVLKLLFLLIVVVVLAVGAYGLTLEKDYDFARSVVIDADVDDVHAWVGDLRKWDEWGPWREQDPSMTYTYGDSTTQSGDKMSWTGKDGSGSLSFTRVDPDRGVEYLFQWEDWDPHPGAVTYRETEDGKVEVTWSMQSNDTPFMMRYMMTLGEGRMNDMFDEGLANLKEKVEGGK